MRRFLIFLTIGIFLLILGRYLIDVTPPFKIKEIQQLIVDKAVQSGDWDGLSNAIIEEMKKGYVFNYLSQSFYLIMFIFALGFVSIFTAIHLLIDKLFFKNFFESPSIFNAVRRGILIAIVLLSLLMFKFLGADLYLYIVLPLIALIIELLIVSLINSRKEIKKLEQEEQAGELNHEEVYTAESNGEEGE